MNEACTYFFLLILLVTTVAYTWAVNKSAPRSSVARRPPVSRLSISGSPPPPVAPMRWDDMEGAYMAMLVVGRGVVELVVDTGSSQLSVKGHGCRWRTCNEDGCGETSCPCGEGRTDCREYYYQPTGRRLNPGEAGAGKSTVMTYGSQTDTVEHYMDVIHLPVLPGMLTCSGLMSAPTQDEFDVLGSSQVSNPNDAKQGIVHRVTRIEGTSSSNLLGLSRPNSGSVEHGKRVLLDTLLDKDRVWSTVLYEDGGWLAFSRMSCFPSPMYMPMIQPAAFKRFLTSFYIAEIVEMRTGESPTSMRPVVGAPRYCVVDTGTTASYGSTQFGRALDAAGYDERRSWMQLKLGSPRSPVTLTYSPYHLQDPEFPSQSVIQAWPGRTLDNFDQIFPSGHGGVFLMGAVMMRNMYWEFDLSHKRIGVSDLRTPTPK